MNTKKISVIIPTYKPEKYLYECLDSLFNQSLEPEKFEVLIVLNGEREPYYAKIDNYIKKKENTKLIYTEKKGVSNARNVGIEKSQYEYIIFLDDDDYFSEMYLESMIKLANPSELVVSNLRCFEGEITSIITSDYISKEFEKFYLDNNSYKITSNLFKMRKFFSNACGKAIYKKDIQNVLFDCSFSKGEDSLFMSMISKNITKIVFTDKNTVYYRRIRKGSASRVKEKRMKILENRYFLIIKYLKIAIIQKKNFIFHLSRICAQIIGGIKEVIR